ncbi:MAG: nucleotidyltransferase family protein [Algoriphagus aquaeductus]|nr:nucleotidyltransferase domain-containing protein [Algoriphagus sp.]
MEKLKAICEKHFVEKLFVFGSALRADFTENSDLDFAVLLSEELDPLTHGESFLNLLNDLEKLFQKKIDLVSYRVIKNPIFKKELGQTKVELYAA